MSKLFYAPRAPLLQSPAARAVVLGVLLVAGLTWAGASAAGRASRTSFARPSSPWWCKLHVRYTKEAAAAEASQVRRTAWDLEWRQGWR